MQPMPASVVTDVRKYPPAGICIYCGSATEGLTTEHIIPLGLGGRWELPQSSCNDCATHTGKIELLCLRRLFWPARMHLDMPSRRKSQRPEKLPLRFLFADGRVSDIDVPISEYPAVLPMVTLDPPGVLVGDDRLFHREVHDFRINTFDENATFLARLRTIAADHGAVDASVISTLDAGAFMQFLAKIAHSFTVAKLGFDGFERSLPGIIDGNFERFSLSYFVGGIKDVVEPGSDIHEVDFDAELSQQSGLLVVRIRLFASLTMPVYYVVSGRTVS